MSFKGTREAFAAAMMDAVKSHSNVILISADSMLAARITDFAKTYPNQFVEVGIGEQCAIGVASGLATTGWMPIVATYAGFLTMRACEQIRTFVAYPNLNVKIVGLNGGMTGGEREGVTHQCYEDIAILRAIPNIKILCPSDPEQTYLATLAMLRTEGPCYLRIGSGKEESIFDEQPSFEVGKARILRKEGHDAVIFTHGFVLNRALRAVDSLRDQGVKVTLVEVPTIVPLDEQTITEQLHACRKVVVYEDHSVYGGLGSAISEVAAKLGVGRVRCMGLKCFPESGTAENLLEKYQLDTPDLVQAVMELC